MNPFLALSFPQEKILWPLLAMMALTAAVWMYMYVRRLSWMFANNVDPQRLATPEGKAATLPEAVERPSNNLRNLFEVPVLFYAACLAIYASGHVDAVTLELAWAYVALRAGHSAVHCTFNHVKTRFTFYFLSCLVLGAMVTRFALQLA